jgi:hypothetical protein
MIIPKAIEVFQKEKEMFGWFLAEAVLQQQREAPNELTAKERDLVELRRERQAKGERENRLTAALYQLFGPDGAAIADEVEIRRAA